MTLISRSAYRLSRRAGQQASKVSQTALLSTAARTAGQANALLRADNRSQRAVLPKAEKGEFGLSR